MDKFIVKIVKPLAYHAGISDSRHEIGITIPAGYDMHMDMVRQTRSGTAIYVYTYIIPVWVDGIIQQFLHIAA